MEIDTETIRRLRETLLATARSSVAATPEVPAGALKEAIVRLLRPFAETMYLVMAADGISEDDEIATLVGALELLCDGRLTRADLHDLVDTFPAYSDLHDQEARIAQLGAVLGAQKADREMAFTLAAVVALADRSVAVEEHSVLQLVGEYLGISPTRADELLTGMR